MNGLETTGTMNQRPLNWILLQLPEATYAALQRHFTQVELQVGMTLAEPEKPTEFVYFPLSGFVSLSVLTESGDSVEVATIGHESLINVGPLIDQPVGPHLATVRGEGSALRIRSAMMREEVRRDPALLHAVHQAAYLKMVQMGQNVVCNRIHSVEQRLARWLLTASDRMQSNSLRLTQEYLSQMLGARRSTVTIAAGDLQRAGLMEYTRGKIRIKDRVELEKAACECYHTLRTATERFRPAALKKA
ncbi:Crp/Fnr family transcriptional regulator [Terriglobus sp. 2YAB30_2]